jgi:dTDP-4-dehydrorhamnose reductase
MKKILITGANGFLGQHLCNHLSHAGFAVTATGRGERRLMNHINYERLELTNAVEVAAFLKNNKFDVIVHTAALSKPDECENNRQHCIEVNVEATKHLLHSASSFFVYTSTDFIFGENGPHTEDQLPEPLNFYGESKLMAEQEVRKSGIQFSIVRPVFIYGKQLPGSRPTFIHWVKDNLEQKKIIKVVSDQQRTPTYVGDINAGIETIINKQATGDYHLAGKDILSPYQMAVQTADVLKLDKSLIEKVTSETFPERVRRAKRSGLNIEKAQKELRYKPVSFEEGVRLTFEVS